MENLEWKRTVAKRAEAFEFATVILIWRNQYLYSWKLNACESHSFIRYIYFNPVVGSWNKNWTISKMANFCVWNQNKFALLAFSVQGFQLPILASVNMCRILFSRLQKSEMWLKQQKFTVSGVQRLTRGWNSGMCMGHSKMCRCILSSILSVSPSPSLSDLVTKVTFRVLAVRRQFPISLRKWRIESKPFVVTD